MPCIQQALSTLFTWGGQAGWSTPALRGHQARPADHPWGEPGPKWVSILGLGWRSRSGFRRGRLGNDIGAACGPSRPWIGRLLSAVPVALLGTVYPAGERGLYQSKNIEGSSLHDFGLTASEALTGAEAQVSGSARVAHCRPGLCWLQVTDDTGCPVLGGEGSLWDGRHSSVPPGCPHWLGRFEYPPATAWVAGAGIPSLDA